MVFFNGLSGDITAVLSLFLKSTEVGTLPVLSEIVKAFLAEMASILDENATSKRGFVEVFVSVISSAFTPSSFIYSTLKYFVGAGLGLLQETLNIKESKSNLGNIFISF